MTNEQYMKNISDNLLMEYGKSNKKNLEGFACMCEVTYGTMRNLIHGRKEGIGVSLRILATISNALGKPVSWLIGESEEKRN